MKLKLNSSEFLVLFQLLGAVVDARPEGIEHNLVHGVLLRLYVKFHRKSVMMGNKVSVKLEKEEACAFYAYTSRLPRQETFTHNLITQINNVIHQKYGV